MKRPLRLLPLFFKRLFKKPSFLLILLLIPLSVLALSVAAKEEGGFITVALAAEDREDPIASEIIDTFLSENSLVNFYFAESPEKAIRDVAEGQTDAAWILPDQMEEAVTLFAKEQSSDVAFVSVVEREENIFLRLAREKLTSALHRYHARALYLDFARENLPHLDQVSDEELMEYYDGVLLDQTFFAFDSADKADQGTSYLTSPIRGLLGVVTVLGALAAALYYLEDEKKGTFSAVPEKMRGVVAFFLLLTATLSISFISLLSLVLSRLVTLSLWEIATTLLFALCSAAFALLILRITGSIPLTASLLPALIVAQIVICPVFFDFRRLAAFSKLFPTTYFANAAFDKTVIWQMLLYLVACLLLSAGISFLRHVSKRFKK